MFPILSATTKLEQVVDDIVVYFAIGGFVLLAVGVILFFVVRKVAKSVMRETEEKIDYSNFDRRDAKDFVKIDDIDYDMIYTEDNKRFIAALEVSGYNYWYAPPEEQAQTRRNYRALFRGMNPDEQLEIMYFPKKVDMGMVIDKYSKKEELYASQIYDKSVEFEELREKMNALYKEDSEAPECQQMLDDLKQLQKELKSLSFKKDELAMQRYFLDASSGDKAEPEIVSYYVFDWEYKNIGNFTKLSDEEIVERAKEELAKKCTSLARTLGDCGVFARRLGVNELIDLLRRQTKPVTASRYRIAEIRNSAYMSAAVKASQTPEEFEAEHNIQLSGQKVDIERVVEVYNREVEEVKRHV